jgi:predicted  nucleic acid-binding Zn-ribbon protein
VVREMTCTKCGEEFELDDGKPGYANICPNCSVPTPEQKARQLAYADSRHKSLTASQRTNERRRDEERKQDLARGKLGYKKVPGKKFTVREPK